MVGVDRDLCVGTGDCVRIAPEAFHLGSADLQARVLPGAAAVEVGRLRMAAIHCPMQAIQVVETSDPRSSDGERSE